MLQKPSEQEKLLLKVPEVLAEELEPESAVAATCEKAEISACSPKSILRGSSDVSSTDASGSGEIGTPPKVISSDSHTLKVQNGGIDGAIYVPLEDPKADTVKQGMVVADVICGESSREMQGAGSGEKHPHEEAEQPLITTGVNAGPNVTHDGNSARPQQQPSTTIVIELSDDDDDDNDELKIIGGNCGENPNDAVWHYMDPQGETRGPFALSLLKRWSDGNYFDSGFRVWKTGQTSHDGLLLADVLRRTFPF